MKLRLAILLSVAALLLNPLEAAGTSEPTLFRDVTVVTMNADSEVLPGRDVLVRDGLIWSITLAGNQPPSQAALVVDGRGKFLVPGLTDLHVHLKSKAELFLYLAHGVTTVFDLSGSPKTLDLRRAVESGKEIGPQIFTTGPTLGGDPPLNPRFVPLSTAADAITAVDQTKLDDYDAIKVYSGILPVAYSAATRRARELGLPVFGHIPWALRADKTLRPGTLAAVAHAEELFAGFYSPTSRYMSADHEWTPGPNDLERTPVLVRLLQDSGASLIVNGRFLDRIVEQAENLKTVLAGPQVQLLPAVQQLEWSQSRYAKRENPKRALQRHRAMASFVPQFVKQLADAGIPMLLGTDASVPGAVPGYSAVREVSYLVDRCGLSPLAALGAATGEVRRFFSRHLPRVAPFGEIRPGFRADLLLLPSDPRVGLEEALLGRAGVMAAGSWHPAEELDAELSRRGRQNKALAGRLAGALVGFQSEDPDSSGEVLTGVLRDFPTAREEVEGLLIEAGAYAARSRPDSDFAAAWARMAAGQIPDSIELRLILIDTLIKRNETKDAREHLLKVLELDPGNEKASKRLKELDAGS